MPHFSLGSGVRNGQDRPADGGVNAIALMSTNPWSARPSVKPFVRRQKNDAADAEAIAEAASRPTMRFVAVKTEEQQARSMILRTRYLLVRQRTQLVNALRGHLAEHGIVAAQGIAKVKVLATAMRDTGSLHRSCTSWARDTSIILPALMSRSRSSTRYCGAPPRTMRRRSVSRACRADHRRGNRGLCAADGDLQARPRLCCLARSRPSATHDGRLAEAGTYVKDGAARHPSPADHRRHDRRQMGSPQRRGQGVVAGPNAGPEAAIGGGHCPGQQDGSFGLGDA